MQSLIFKQASHITSESSYFTDLQCYEGTCPAFYSDASLLEVFSYYWPILKYVSFSALLLQMNSFSSTVNLQF